MKLRESLSLAGAKGDPDLPLAAEQKCPEEVIKFDLLWLKMFCSADIICTEGAPTYSILNEAASVLIISSKTAT